MHRLVHFRDDSWHITLTDISNVRNRVTPDNRASCDAGHLRRKGNFDLHATLVIEFFEFLQTSAEHVVGIAATVIRMYAGKSSARMQSFCDRVGHEITRVDGPAMVRIEADLLRRCLV